MFLPTVCEEQNLLEEQFVLFCKTQRVLLRRNGRFSKIEEEKGGFSSDYYLQMKIVIQNIKKFNISNENKRKKKKNGLVH